MFSFFAFISLNIFLTQYFVQRVNILRSPQSSVQVNRGLDTNVFKTLYAAGNSADDPSSLSYLDLENIRHKEDISDGQDDDIVEITGPHNVTSVDSSQTEFDTTVEEFFAVDDKYRFEDMNAPSRIQEKPRPFKAADHGTSGLYDSEDDLPTPAEPTSKRNSLPEKDTVDPKSSINLSKASDLAHSLETLIVGAASLALYSQVPIAFATMGVYEVLKEIFD